MEKKPGMRSIIDAPAGKFGNRRMERVASTASSVQEALVTAAVVLSDLRARARAYRRRIKKLPHVDSEGFVLATFSRGSQTVERLPKSRPARPRAALFSRGVHDTNHAASDPGSRIADGLAEISGIGVYDDGSAQVGASEPMMTAPGSKAKADTSRYSKIMGRVCSRNTIGPIGTYNGQSRRRIVNCAVGQIEPNKGPVRCSHFQNPADIKIEKELSSVFETTPRRRVHGNTRT